MKLTVSFREVDAIKRLERAIKASVERLGRVIRIMEFCGGHTHTILKHGIDQLLEGYVRFVHGPGCPVCVLPMQRVDLIPYSSLKINSRFADFDAERRFSISLPRPKEHPACICGKVIRGVAQPKDCKLFASVCTPSNPIGSCMVSSEGACNAYYKYRWQG